MTHPDRIDLAQRQAETLFESGLNCAESALLALAQLQNVDAALMPRIASCFGGGMAQTGGTCGALTGAIMGLGLAFGRARPGDPIDNAKQGTQRLVQEFEQAFGARDCHVLLRYDPKGPDSKTAFAKEGRRERCAHYTGAAVGIAARIIAEHGEQK